MRSTLGIVGLVVVITSCISIPGDGIIQVVGEIVPSPDSGASCSLSLRSPTEPDRVLESREVAGQFTVNFMVPPNRNSYLVELHCSDASKGAILVARPQREEADFGRIAL